jgi:hypothetical protein
MGGARGSQPRLISATAGLTAVVCATPAPATAPGGYLGRFAAGGAALEPAERDTTVASPHAISAGAHAGRLRQRLLRQLRRTRALNQGDWRHERDPTRGRARRTRHAMRRPRATAAPARGAQLRSATRPHRAASGAAGGGFTNDPVDPGSGGGFDRGNTLVVELVVTRMVRRRASPAAGSSGRLASRDRGPGLTGSGQRPAAMPVGSLPNEAACLRGHGWPPRIAGAASDSRESCTARTPERRAFRRSRMDLSKSQKERGCRVHASRAPPLGRQPARASCACLDAGNSGSEADHVLVQRLATLLERGNRIVLVSGRRGNGPLPVPSRCA